jgi:NAD(P)-dependent dehydrogenase (short-subunit alcohol dehydrogenase family)
MKELKERTAVVTGAASGIGRAMAGAFLNEGMNVVLADIDEERLNDTVRSFKDAGGSVLGAHTDVSDVNQVQTLALKALDSFGAVHVLCNNAGIGYPTRSSWEAPLEVWKWVLDVNLMGVIHGIQTFVPIMLKQEMGGHIVNTASIAGLISSGISAAYGVSKHAVVALSEALHIEFLTRNANVKVSVLCPGNVNTDIMNASQRFRPQNVPPPYEMTPEEEIFRNAYATWLERGMDPAEVARQVVAAIREERFYVITHDFNSYIDTRMKNILSSKNPELMPPPEDFLILLQEQMERRS